MAQQPEMQRAFGFDSETEDLRLEAERAVQLAEDLDRVSDPSTEREFKKAELLTNQAADERLQLRLHRSFGQHYARRRRPRDAREHWIKAERTAQVLDQPESAAQLRILICEMEIELSGDGTRRAFFQNFKRAAKGCECSWIDREDVWCRFVDDCTAADGRLAARKFGSYEDFCSRLEEAKLRGANEGDS